MQCHIKYKIEERTCKKLKILLIYLTSPVSLGEPSHTCNSLLPNCIVFVLYCIAGSLYYLLLNGREREQDMIEVMF